MALSAFYVFPPDFSPPGDMSSPKQDLKGLGGGDSYGDTRFCAKPTGWLVSTLPVISSAPVSPTFL